MFFEAASGLLFSWHPWLNLFVLLWAGEYSRLKLAPSGGSELLISLYCRHPDFTPSSARYCHFWGKKMKLFKTRKSWVTVQKLYAVRPQTVFLSLLINPTSKAVWKGRSQTPSFELTDWHQPFMKALTVFKLWRSAWGKYTFYFALSISVQTRGIKKEIGSVLSVLFCHSNFNNSSFPGVICNLFVIWLGASQRCFQRAQFPAAVKKMTSRGKESCPVGEEPWERKAKRPGRKSCLNLPEQSEDSTWHHPMAPWRPLVAVMKMLLLLLPLLTESFTYLNGLSL